MRSSKMMSCSSGQGGSRFSCSDGSKSSSVYTEGDRGGSVTTAQHKLVMNFHRRVPNLSIAHKLSLDREMNLCEMGKVKK